MFLYDRTDKTISHNIHDDQEGVYRSYSNARWFKHGWRFSMAYEVGRPPRLNEDTKASLFLKTELIGSELAKQKWPSDVTVLIFIH